MSVIKGISLASEFTQSCLLKSLKSVLNAGTLLALQAKAGGYITWVCCEAFKHMGFTFSAKVLGGGIGGRLTA